MSDEKKGRVIDRACQMYGQNARNLAKVAVACMCVGMGLDIDKTDENRLAAMKKLILALQHLSYAATIQALLDGAALGILQPSVFVEVDLMEQPCSEELLKEFMARMDKSGKKEDGDGE